MRVAQQRLGGQPEGSEPGCSSGEAGSQCVADPPQVGGTWIMEAWQPLRDLCHTVTLRPMGAAKLALTGWLTWVAFVRLVPRPVPD